MRFDKIEEIDECLKIGLHSGKKKRWYAICYSEIHQKNFEHSLKLVEPEDGTERKEAIRRARKHYKDFYNKVSVGVHPTTNTSFLSVSTQYLAHIRELGELNQKEIDEGRTPLHYVEHGTDGSIHTIEKADVKAKHMENIYPYILSLPKKDDITKLTSRAFDGFPEWALKKYKWSPSTVARHITAIRAVFWFARDKGMIDDIPNIKSPPQKLEERSRRNLTEDEYNMMIDWAWDRKERLRNSKWELERYRADDAYQFFIWIMILSYVGCRPPSGRVDKNLLRWESWEISRDKDGSEIHTFWREEKGLKRYEAVIMPEAVPWFYALKKLHKDRGINSPYMFVHTNDRKGQWRKGDPIKNFKKSWRDMLTTLGLDSPKGSQQKDRLAPYSLRGYFITMRLEYGHMRIEDLARATGTSVKMIEQTYKSYSTKRNYKPLISGTRYNKNETIKYDEHGDLMLPNALDLKHEDNGINI